MKQTLFLKCSAHLLIGAIPNFNFKILMDFFITFFITVVLIEDIQFCQTFPLVNRSLLKAIL